MSLLRASWPNKQDHLQESLDNWEDMQKQAEALSPYVVDRLVMKFGSLRAAAKQVGLSPTYLSLIRSGKTRCSVKTCLHLVKWYNNPF